MTKDPRRQLLGRTSKAQGKQFEARLDASFAYGRTVLYEAKFTASDRIEQSRVSEGQTEYLTRLDGLGARCYVLAGFASGEVYRVPWRIWSTMKDHFGRKYVTEADLQIYKVQRSWNDVLLILD